MAIRIRKLLQATDSSLQQQALEHLSKHPEYNLLPQAVGLISSPDPEVAKHAKEVSVDLAKQIVTARSRDMAEVVVAFAADTIKKHDPYFLQQTNQKLTDEKPETVIDGLITLKYFVKEDDAADLLRRFIRHPSHKVRATAAFHLGVIGCRRNPNILTRYLEDGDNRVKANAIEVLEELGNKSFIPVLARFRNHPNNRVRANVLKALFMLGNEDIYDDLKVMLTHEIPLMRTSAVWVIGEIGSMEKRYIELLKLVIEEEDKLLCSNLLIAQKKIGNVPETEFLRAKLKDLMRSELKQKIIKDAQLRITETKTERYVLVELEGSITASSVLSAKFRLSEIVRQHEEIVLNFGKVEYIDSSGIGLLVNLTKIMDQKTGTLFICNCRHTITELLQLSKVDQRLNLFHTLEEIQDFLGVDPAL